MIVWLNGEFLPAEEAYISPSDRGFTLGDGVFDTMLAVDGEPVSAEEHFNRLHRHAAVIELSVPETIKNLQKISISLLRENNFITGRYSIRTTVTRGSGPRGLTPAENPEPTLLMTASPASDPENLPPLKAIISETTRRNEYSPLSRIKSLNYGDNLLALMEAKNKKADDAIILNTKGNVTCATTGNIFIKEKDKLFTPPLSDGVLDGITRLKIIAEQQAIEESLTPDRLKKAKSIYVTNSITGMRPLIL